MTSIFFLKVAIYLYILRYNYLRNQKHFLNSFLNFLNLESIFKFFNKKVWPRSVLYIWTYGLQKTWLDKCLKSPVSEDPSTSNMVNGPKQFSNLNETPFTIFIDLCEYNWGLKSLWLISKILGLFLDALSSDNKYSLLIRENL